MEMQQTVAAEVRAHNASVAESIRERLRQAGRSQGDLAAALGWTPQFLSRRLTGHVDFSLSEIAAIASALDVPRNQLLEATIPMRRVS